MTKKIKISSYPEDGKADYSHLDPVVNYLIDNGNESVNPYIWGNNRTGYFCHFKYDIDFDEILSLFEFPESIKVDKIAQKIDCFNTFTVIKRI